MSSTPSNSNPPLTSTPASTILGWLPATLCVASLPLPDWSYQVSTKPSFPAPTQATSVPSDTSEALKSASALSLERLTRTTVVFPDVLARSFRDRIKDEPVNCWMKLPRLDSSVRSMVISVPSTVRVRTPSLVVSMVIVCPSAIIERTRSGAVRSIVTVSPSTDILRTPKTSSVFRV